MKQSAFFLIILFLPFVLQAQEAGEISLQDAIDIALKNNYQLKQASNNLSLANDRLVGEKLDFAPAVNANARGFKQIGRQFIPGTGNFEDVSVTGFNTGLNADLPIFTGFENINSLHSTQFDKKSQEQNREWVRENIIFQTASNYLQVLLDQKLLQIAKENLETSKQQLKQVNAQVDVGSRPTVDGYNQEATVANNELEVTNKDNALKLSRLKLIRSMQVDPRKEYKFETPDIEDKEKVRKNYNLQELISTALENRSDLRREQFNIQSLKYNLKATKGSLYPMLSASASISSSYNDQNYNRLTGELITFRDQYLDLNINKSLGLSLNIPIFNNFDRRLNVQTQRINYKNAQLALEDTRQQIIQEVNQAYNDYESILKQLSSTEKALTAAERSYTSQKKRYDVGAGTLIELSQSNAQFTQAKADRASTIYNFVFQKKILDYYIGKLNKNITLE